MDAYHNVNSGTACLAVHVTRAINDPRAPGGQPAKFAARLQVASSVDYSASHGCTKAQLDDQLADEDGLPLWPLGDPDLEPRAGVAL
jgi:prolyl oligopeptidase